MSNRLRLLNNICYGLLLFLLLVFFSFFMYRSARLILYRFGIDYMEGFVLAISDLLSAGRDIYHPLAQPPYLMPTYTPIYYLLCALLGKMSGLGFWVGRSLSAAAALVTGVVIFLDSRRQTGERVLPLAAMLFFFAVPVIYVWAPLMRVDSVAVALSVAGLYFVQSRRRYSLLFSCVLFILAIYTRQNMISAPLAALLYLWLVGERRKAFSLLFGLLAFGSAILLACVLVSGTDFLKHVFLYNINEVRWASLRIFYPPLLREQFVFILAGVIYAIWCFARRQANLASLYFLMAGLSTLGILKLGASINYFYEFGAACCLIITPIVSESKKALEKMQRADLLFIIPVLLFVQAILLYHRPHHYRGEFFGETPHGVTDTEKEQVVEFLRTTGGPVITINPEFALFSGKEVYMEPLFYTLMADYGYWDQRDFVSEIENRRFSAIVLPFDIGRPNTTNIKYVFLAEHSFTARMEQAIYNNYRPKQRFGEYRVLIPRDRYGDN